MNSESSVFLSTLDQRKKDHARNPKLDEVIAELRELLEPVQQKITEEQGCAPRFPVGLVLGCPRSGTTLALQFLASVGFAYPSNLFTRFAYAPHIGILIQKMLFDESFGNHGDLAGLDAQIGFSSNLGKSKGVLAPNECFHFWRRFMPNFDLQWLEKSDMEKVDFQGLERELGLIEKGFGKPFCAKGLMQQYNIAEFYNRMPFLFFFRIRREPMFVMQSILRSRESFYGTRELWWSVKPREYDRLKEMDIYHQIAGQMFFTEKAITEGLQQVPESHQLTVDYEAFCADPAAFYRSIAEKYSALGYALPADYRGEKSFTCSNKINLTDAEVAALESAYADFADGRLML